MGKYIINYIKLEISILHTAVCEASLSCFICGLECLSIEFDYEFPILNN